MKQRVMGQLAGLSENPNHQLMDELSADLEMEPADISEKAGSILRHMLHNYAELSICTIDKFMHQLVRTFARDLTLSHDFEVETDRTPFIEEAVARLIEQVGRDSFLTDILVDFVESQLDSDRSWQIERSLIEVGSKQLNLQSDQFLKQLEEYPLDRFSELKKELRTFMAAFEKEVQALGEQAMQIVEKNSLGNDDFYYKSGGILSFFRALQKGDVLKTPNTRGTYSIENNQFENTKSDADRQLLVQELAPEFQQICTAVETVQEKRGGTYSLCEELLRNFHQLLLLNELNKSLNNLKEERNLIFVDDFHRLISSVVKEEPAPFVYERIGQRYSNLLIDEFQDTSILQWQNFLPLAADALSTGGFVLLVGDGKQAIYRWRGGEVEQFDRLPEIYPKAEDSVSKEREQLLKYQYNPKNLDKNYRSLGEVVRFNNDLYEELQKYITQSLRTVYNDANQEVVKQDDAGMVTVDLLDIPGRGNAEEKLAAYFEKTERYIAEALNDGYSQRDICVITRKNKQGQQIAQFLQHKMVGNQQLELISNESLLIDSHPGVQLMISAMTYLSDTRHPGYALNLLRQLVVFYKSSDVFHELMSQFTKRNERKQLIKADVNGFLKSIGKPVLSRRLFTLNLYEMAEELARQFGAEKFNNPYWSFFKQQVWSFAYEQGNDLLAFLGWWEKKRQKLSLSIPEDSNAIRLMSIHRSKGLQFPVVILPFAEWEIKNSQQIHWAPVKEEFSEKFKAPVPPVMLTGLSQRVADTHLKEQIETENSRLALDSLNMLYVATTRAEERLYLVSRQQNMGKDGASNIAQWLTAYADSAKWQDFPVRYGNKGPRSQYFQEKDHSKPGSQSATYPIGVASNSGWKEKVRISLEAGEMADGVISPTSRSVGNLVHRILSEIKNPEELSERLNWNMSRGIIDKAQRLEIEIQINALLEHPEAGKWFHPHEKVLIEQAIVTPGGHTTRPDRVIIDGKNATIIDFKTGEERPEHREQITEYGKLLSAMGYQCTLYLYYLESHRAVKVEENPQTVLF